MSGGSTATTGCVLIPAREPTGPPRVTQAEPRQTLPAAQKILRPGVADVKDFDLWLLQPPGTKKGP